VLLLQDLGVRAERPPDLEILPLDDALRASDFAADYPALDGDF
jgi:hypothetical protein